MKANAPEKIYLQQYDENTLICLNKWNISDEWTNKPFNEKVATNIEYTRTDAFVEKACGWIRDNYLKYPSEDCADTTKFVMDFRKYMNENKL